jgi:hypothetical protein
MSAERVRTNQETITAAIPESYSQIVHKKGRNQCNQHSKRWLGAFPIVGDVGGL